MSDDLVAQIKKRRLHHMYPHHLDELLNEAAQALTEARAEIERLKSGINGIVNCQGPMTRAQVREACAEILDNKTVGFDNQSPFAAALGDWKVRATTMEISVKEAARSIHNLMTRAVAAESRAEQAESALAEAVEALRSFAEGSLDVSGTAVIIGYSGVVQALVAARAFVKEHGSDSSTERNEK